MSEDNKHKLYSPSGSATWLNCGGALAFVSSLDPTERDTGETVASRRGTAAHAVAEFCLHEKNPGLDPHDYVRMEVEGVLIDNRIADAVKVFVDECRTFGGDQYVEVKTNLDYLLGKFAPDLDPDEHGGTCDFGAWDATTKTLTVKDFKNGESYVDHETSTQIKIYGLGMLCKLGLVEFAGAKPSAKTLKRWEAITVDLGICQPNVPGPASRTVTTNARELVDWFRTEYIPSVRVSMDALEQAAYFGTLDEYLNPGEKQCEWCPGRFKCPKGYQFNFAQMGIALKAEYADLLGDGDPGELVAVVPAVETLTDEQIELVLNYGSAFKRYVDSVFAYAERMNHANGPSLGHKLINRSGHRKYVEDRERKLCVKLKRMGLTPADYMQPPVMVSPAQLETILKNRGVTKEDTDKLFETFVTKPITGVKLVPETHPSAAVNVNLVDQYDDLLD